MVKKKLWHPDFDGEISGGYSRRGILSELDSNRYVIETKWQRKARKIGTYLLIALVVVALMLGVRIVSSWIDGDKFYDVGLKQKVYKANGMEVTKEWAESGKKKLEKADKKQ